MKKLTSSHLLVTALSLLVTAVVVTSFLILGSPESERVRRYDQERVQHLQSLSSTIDIFWTNESRLPNSLEEMRGSRNYYIEGLVDPITGESYAYTLLSEQSYELCATFDTKNGDEPQIPPRAPGAFDRSTTFWSHEAGRVCFTIDALPVPVQRIQ